jgi:hypothetical protein
VLITVGIFFGYSMAYHVMQVLSQNCPLADYCRKGSSATRSSLSARSRSHADYSNYKCGVGDALAALGSRFHLMNKRAAIATKADVLQTSTCDNYPLDEVCKVEGQPSHNTKDDDQRGAPGSRD